MHHRLMPKFSARRRDRPDRICRAGGRGQEYRHSPRRARRWLGLAQGDGYPRKPGFNVTIVQEPSPP